MLALAALTLCALLPLVNATPTPTDGLARRSFQSGGVTCYYACPGMPGASVFEITIGNIADCTYTSGEDSSSQIVCYFDTTTGKAIEDPQGFRAPGPGCAAQASGPFCGSPPSGSTYFKKRSLVAPSVEEQERREAVVRAREAIQHLQHKPTRREGAGKRREEE